MPAEVTVEAKAVDGSRLAPYDLFVGAAIVVLKRRVILKKMDVHTVAQWDIHSQEYFGPQADLETQKWLDLEAHRLLHAKRAVEDELGKFTSVSVDPLSLPLPHRMHTHSMYGRYEDMGGRVNLRRLSKEVDGHIAALKKYRARLPAILDSKGGEEVRMVPTEKNNYFLLVSSVEP
ncbi:hypothetical protein BSKO_09630 [Bryopsis sp. KO-2023]|nr:hypothetical protein BSKO_09630 [Bryopsis sp. KO-2023]